MTNQPDTPVESEPDADLTLDDVRAIDPTYDLIPPFSAWSALEVETSVWDSQLAVLDAQAALVTAEDLERAREVVLEFIRCEVNAAELPLPRDFQRDSSTQEITS